MLVHNSPNEVKTRARNWCLYTIKGYRTNANHLFSQHVDVTDFLAALDRLEAALRQVRYVKRP